MKKRFYQSNPFKHNYGFGPTTVPTRNVQKPKRTNTSLLETIVSALIGFDVKQIINPTPESRLYSKILALYKSSINNS